MAASRSCISLLRVSSLSMRATRLRSTVAFTDGGRLKSSDEIPGPKGWPLVGSLLDVLSDFRDKKAMDEFFFNRQHYTWGPIYKLNIMGKRSVSVAVPEAVPLVQRAEGPYPSRGGPQHDGNMEWIYTHNDLPQPMFFAANKEWKRIRSSASKQIVPRRVASFTASMNELSREFTDHLAAVVQRGGGNIDDMTDEVSKFALQGVSFFVFSEKLNVYDDINPDYIEMEKAAKAFIGSLFAIGNAIPLYKYFPTKVYRTYLSNIDRVQTIGRKIMSKKYTSLKAVMETGRIDETRANGLMEQWLIEGKFTEEEVLMQSCDMLAAGIDTTTNTSTFMLHELAKNPTLQDRVCEEIRSVMGGRESPTFQDLQKMSLIRGCIKETLRLYPAVWAFFRYLDKPIELLGYHIPEQTGLHINMYVMSRNPDYVEEPLVFKPERWSRDGSAPKLDPFISVPFGFGPRSCYGRRLAELEMYSMLAHVIPRFKMSTGQTSLKVKTESVMKPAEPVQIQLTERK